MQTQTKYVRPRKAEYDRERQKNPEYRMRDACRARSKYYLKRGLIERKPCETCGNPKADMHHDDYADHWNVRWLCRRHHKLLHLSRDN